MWFSEHVEFSIFSVQLVFTFRCKWFSCRFNSRGVGDKQRIPLCYCVGRLPCQFIIDHFFVRLVSIGPWRCCCLSEVTFTQHAGNRDGKRKSGACLYNRQREEVYEAAFRWELTTRTKKLCTIYFVLGTGLYKPHHGLRQ